MAYYSHIQIPQSNTKEHKLHFTPFTRLLTTRNAGQVANSWHDGHRLLYQAKPYRLNRDPRYRNQLAIRKRASREHGNGFAVVIHFYYSLPFFSPDRDRKTVHPAREPGHRFPVHRLPGNRKPVGPFLRFDTLQPTNKAD